MTSSESLQEKKSLTESMKYWQSTENYEIKYEIIRIYSYK